MLINPYSLKIKMVNYDIFPEFFILSIGEGRFQVKFFESRYEYE